MNEICCGTLLLSVDKQSCLLVQQKHTGKWSVPKGSKVPHETIRECMEREFWEETGLVLKKCRYRYFSTHRYKKYHIQVLQLLHGHHTLKLQPRDTREIEKVEWVPLRQAQTHHRLNMITRYVLDPVRYYLRPNRTWYWRQQVQPLGRNNLSYVTKRTVDELGS
jgi:8-oxo-dGTP pyrophosphatase MutT (NUDIX family)